MSLGFRSRADLRNEKINGKIRKAQMEKIPYMVVLGDKEVENGTLSVRNRFEGDLGPFSFEKFLELIEDLKKNKAVPTIEGYSFGWREAACRI